MEKGSKNIGILTFHRALNYGAFSQAYALKTFLESCGHRVSFVDYWPKAHAETYALFRINRKVGLIGNVLRFFKALLIAYSLFVRKTKMEQEVRRFLNLSKAPLYDSVLSLKNAPSYDCLVYGSDQIWWNSIVYGYEGFDGVYWGEYMDKTIRKISYAPSMGIIQLGDDEQVNVKTWLKNFDAISVRESELFDVLQPLTQKTISVVLDPVFLLDREYWSNLCTEVKFRDYILFYNVMTSKDAKRFVRLLKKKTGKKVIEITGKVEPFRFGANVVQSASTVEWLSLMYHADSIVSTSFHGVAFSVIFQKNFYALGMSNKTGRVLSLLSSLHIENRLVDGFRDVFFDAIDYNDVQNRIELLKAESIRFLLDAVDR